MSEAKFTKGEWELSTQPESEHYCLTVECGKVMRVNVITRATDISFVEGLERVANAHLIAAAPSMYAMLEEVTKELYNLIDEVNDQRLSHVNASSLTQPVLCDHETIHNIQLLLAKARGE